MSDLERSVTAIALDRTNADARAASAARVLVQFRNKGTTDARPEVNRLLGTGVTAGLAGDAGFCEAGIRYGH